LSEEQLVSMGTDSIFSCRVSSQYHGRLLEKPAGLKCPLDAKAEKIDPS